MVPVEVNDAKAAICGARKKNSEAIEELAENAQSKWSRGKARGVLNQLYTGFCTMFHPMRGLITLSTDKCPYCNEGDTVDYFFNCIDRMRGRRAYYKA